MPLKGQNRTSNIKNRMLERHHDGDDWWRLLYACKAYSLSSQTKSEEQDYRQLLGEQHWWSIDETESSIKPVWKPSTVN